MSRALSNAKSLTTLICAPYASMLDSSKEDHSLTLVKTILEGFLDHADRAGEFIWENHYKLERITVGSSCCVRIGSDLKSKDATDVVTIGKGDRMVMHRRVHIMTKPGILTYRQGSSKWLERVTGSMVLV